MRAHITPLGVLLLAGTLGLTTGGCGGIVDEDARATFMKSLGHTSITVFPAFVRHGAAGEYDAEAATRIAEFLAGRQLATAARADAHVPITGPWRTNQAKMLRASAADFAAYLEAHPIDTAYALLPEYLMGGRGAVGGIHCYVLDSDGTVAFAVLLNSHHKAFADAKPQSVTDCTDVLIEVLRETLKPGPDDHWQSVEKP